MRFSVLALMAACALFLTAPGAKADAVGTLVLTSGTGEMSLTINTIMFGTPTDSTSIPPGAYAQVASGTNLTFVGGPMAPGDGVTMANLIFPPIPVTNWMTFLGFPNLKYTVTGEGPGSPDTNCAALAVTQTCSPFPGDPVVLELGSGSTTDLSLSLNGTVTDGTLAENWVGSITATITENLPNGAAPTPGDIQAYFAADPDGALTVAYSGSFTSRTDVTTTPEPGTFGMMLIASGLLGLAYTMRLLATAK
jgi:PEP-CTERM motif